MRWLANIPIRGKLILVTVLASAVALLLAGSIIVTYDSLAYRTQKTREISVQAEILATSVTASLVFSDPVAAQEYLRPLEANPEIAAAGVYAADSSIFASYFPARTLSQPLPERAEPQGHRFEDNELLVFWPVTSDRRQVGTVHLRVRTEPLATRLWRYGGIILLVMIGSLLITLPISTRLHAVISNPIRELAQAVSRIAGGDLTVSVASVSRKDELGLLSTKTTEMIENLRAITRQIGEGAQLLLKSAGEILETTIQMVSATSETATTVAETTTTAEEVRQTAQVAGQKAKDVSTSAQKASQVSQAGRKSVEDTIQGIHRIQEQMESIAASVVRSSERSQAIGEIIATVSDLAEQSNLLAVNAAIEAAKAGEHGKGFSVVAQEVRRLAEQSRQATSQVRTILGDIQKATTAAVLATEQGSKAVQAGEKQAKAAGESIQALAGSLTEAAQAATQIAASSQQQLVGVDQVASAMESIRQASAQNASSAQQLENAARNLNELGQRLKQMVERYKV
jgi:methyl-accepting chemotaxis protein